MGILNETSSKKSVHVEEMMQEGGIGIPFPALGRGLKSIGPGAAAAAKTVGALGTSAIKSIGPGAAAAAKTVGALGTSAIKSIGPGAAAAAKTVGALGTSAIKTVVSPVTTSLNKGVQASGFFKKETLDKLLQYDDKKGIYAYYQSLLTFLSDTPNITFDDNTSLKFDIYYRTPGEIKGVIDKNKALFEDIVVPILWRDYKQDKFMLERSKKIFYAFLEGYRKLLETLKDRPNNEYKLTKAILEAAIPKENFQTAILDPAAAATNPKAVLLQILKTKYTASFSAAENAILQAIEKWVPYRYEYYQLYKEDPIEITEWKKMVEKYINEKEKEEEELKKILAKLVAVYIMESIDPNRLSSLSKSLETPVGIGTSPPILRISKRISPTIGGSVLTDTAKGILPLFLDITYTPSIGNEFRVVEDDGTIAKNPEIKRLQDEYNVGFGIFSSALALGLADYSTPTTPPNPNFPLIQEQYAEEIEQLKKLDEDVVQIIQNLLTMSNPTAASFIMLNTVLKEIETIRNNVSLAVDLSIEELAALKPGLVPTTATAVLPGIGAMAATTSTAASALPGSAAAVRPPAPASPPLPFETLQAALQTIQNEIKTRITKTQEYITSLKLYSEDVDKAVLAKAKANLNILDQLQADIAADIKKTLGLADRDVAELDEAMKKVRDAAAAAAPPAPPPPMAAAPPTTGGKDAYNKINEKDKPVGITRGGEQSCFAIALFQLLVRSNSFLTVFYNIDIDSLNEEQEKIYNSLKNVIDAYASSEINGDEYTPVGTLAEKGEEGKACILKNTEGKIETDDSSSQYNYILTKLKITPDPLSLECLDNLGTQPKLLDIGCTYDKEEFLVHVNDSHSTDKNKKLASDVKKILPIYEMFGYTLKGFTVHIGFHYIAYINHKNTWWLCNDAEKITEQDSLNTILDEIGDKTNKSITLLLLTKTKGENFTDIKENLKAIYTDGTVNDVIDDTQKKNKGYIIEYIKQVQKVDKLLNIKKDIEQVGYTNLGFAKPSISDIIADVSTQLKNYFTLATELKIDSTKDLYKIKMIKIPARFDIKEPTDDKDKRPFYRDAAVCNEYIQKLNITIIPDKIKPYLNNSVDNLYQLLQASKTYLADNKNSNNLIEALKKYTELLSDISMTYAGKDKITYKDIEVLNLTEAQKNKYDTLLSASRAAALTGSNKSKNESWDSDIHINLDSIIQNYTDYNDTKQILTLLKVLIKEDSFLSTNPPNASPPPATLIEIEFGNEYEVLLSLLADVDNSTRSITKINEIFNPMQDGTNKYYLNIVDVLNKIMSKLTLSRADLKVNEDTINGILTLLISLYPPKDKGTLEGRENDVDLLFDIDTFKKTYLTKILENLDKLPMYPETKDRDKLKFLDLAISRFDIQLPDNPRIVDIIQSLLRKISKVTDNNATKLKNFTKIITNFSILRKDIDNKSLKDKDTQEKIKAAKFFEKTFEIILENETPILNKNNLIVNTDFPKEWTKSGSDVFISYNNFIYLETIMNQNNNEFTESLNKYKTKTGDGSLPLSSSLHIGGTPPMEGAQQAAVVAGPAPSQVELRLAKIKEDIKNSEKLRKKINEIQDNIKGVQQIWDTYKQNVTIKNFKDLSAVSILDYLVGEMNKDISNETTLTSFATDTSFMYSNIFKSVIYSGDLKNPPSYSLKPYNSKANTWRVYNTAIPQQSAWTGAKFSEYDTKLDQLDKEREKFVRNLNSLKNIFINNNDLSSNLYMEQFKLLVNILTIFKSKDKSILTAADISTATIPDNIISTILDEKLSYREEISKKLDAIKGQNKGYALRNISEQVKSAISGKNLCVFLKEVDGTDTGGSVIKYYYLNLEEIKKEIQSYKEVYDNTPGYTASDIFGTNEYLQKDAPRLKETLKTKIDEIKKGTNEVLTKLTAYGEEYGPSNPAIKSKVLEVLKPLDVSKEPFTIEEKLNQLVRVMSADIEYYTNEFGKQKTGIEKAQQLQSAQGLQRGGVDGEEATNSIKQQRAELDKLFKPYKKNPSDTESVDETIYKEINNLREVNNSFLTNIKKAADPTISLSLQGTDSIFNSLFNKYNQSKQDTSKGEYVASQELAEGLKTNELLPRDVLKIDFRDKVIFIFASLFLRLIALAIIEYVIDKGKISNLKWAVLSFLGIFTGLFYLLVLVVNLDSYKLRIVFNYVNFHANSSIAIVYPAMLWLFGLAIYYIMWNINGGDGVTAANDEDRLRLKYRIQVLSMITWLFLSLMVLLF